MVGTGNVWKGSSVKPGDVVNIFFEGSSYTKEAYNQTAPLNNRFFTTHVGIVKADDQGNLYVEHNVHGKVEKDKLQDFVDGKVKGNGKNKVSLIAGITRPNYFDGVDNDGRIPAAGMSYYQTEYGQFNPQGALANDSDYAARSIAGETTYKFLSTIEKNKDAVLKDIPISENEFGKLMRVARVIPTLETYAGSGADYNPNPSVLLKVHQDAFMPNREKSMGITSLKDETNLNEQLRSKLYKSDYDLSDPVKAGLPTFYVLSKNYLYLKEVANEYELDLTSDQLAKLAGLSYNQSIGKVAAELIQKGGYDNYIKYRRDTAKEGDGKFKYHGVIDLYDKQTMKHGGWLKKYQDGAQVGPRISNLPKEEKAPTPNIPVHPVNRGYVAKLVPGVSGSMKTIYVNPETGQGVELPKETEKQMAMSNMARSNNVDIIGTSLLGAGMAKPAFKFAQAAIPFFDAPLMVGSTTVPGVTLGNVLNAAGAGYSTEQILNPESDLRTNPNPENVTATALGFVGLPYKAGLAAMADDLGTISQFVTTQTPVKNTWKLLPEGTFKNYSKLNNPNKSYRVAGFDNAEDFTQSGVLRSKTPKIPEGLSFEERMLFGRPTSFPSFQKGYADLRYLPEEGGVVFETSLPTFKRGEINPITGLPIKGRHYAHRVLDPETGKAMVEIPSENIKMFEGTPNWLRGYKQIDVPKQLPDSPNIVSAVDDVGKNLTDLQEAQKFAQQYGYELPKNLERIAQSDMLTDRTIRGMMDRHNTFVRGVSTNWDEIAKKNPEILRHLEGKGIDWKNNPKAAAEYMATHIPINTGYGRASLNTEVFDRGLQGLYTSNSIPTAEGYTYGRGFITKVKKPTDFSSVNRQDWITKNNPHYRDEDKFRELMFPLSDEAEYAIHSSKSKLWRPKSADEKLLKNATSKQKAIKEIEYRIEQLKKDISEIEPNKDKWVDATEVSYSKKELVKQLENDIKYLEKHGDEILQAPGEFNLLRTERSNLPTDPYNFLIAKEGNAKRLSEWLKKQSYQEKMKEANDLGESLTKYSWDEQQPIRAKIKELENEATIMYNQSVQDYMKANHPDYDPVNKYAHYIHLGTPGQKVLEPIKSWEITPEIWKNKSRSHTNKYSKKFSALEYGGFVGIGGAAAAMAGSDTPQQKYGGWLSKYQDGGSNFRTQLTPEEEKAFKDWYSKLSTYKGLSENPDSEEQQYDYRGYWKNENREGILGADPEAHFIDKYKQPGHPTFSTESQYSTGQTPGGEWSTDEYGTWYFNHSPYTAKDLAKTQEYLRGTGEYSINPYTEEVLTDVHRNVVPLVGPTAVFPNDMQVPVVGIDGKPYMRNLQSDSYKKGGWLSRYQEGGMPLDLPLKSANPGSPWAYQSPQANGYLLPDVNRPELLNTGATEYKMGIDGDITIPTVVNGQYMDPDQAYQRYLLTGEQFKPMVDPGSYSKFYNTVGELGLMKQKKGGPVHKNQYINNVTLSKTSSWLNKYK